MRYLAFGFGMLAILAYLAFKFDHAITRVPPTQTLLGKVGGAGVETVLASNGLKTVTVASANAKYKLTCDGSDASACLALQRQVTAALHRTQVADFR